MDLIEEMMSHANEAAPEEACGLVVSRGEKHFRLIRAKNLDQYPRANFTLDPEAWLKVGEHETVIGIYHSHPHGPATPSVMDLTACERGTLPWYIVSPGTGGHEIIHPSGYRAPYEKRPYAFAVLDCYSLLRDWYLGEMLIDLPDIPRTDKFWVRGENLFGDKFESLGFVRLIDQEVQRGDAFLMQMGGYEVPNHCAIYLGDGKILHHAHGQLSCVVPWGGYWAKHATHHLRHKKLIDG